MADQTEKENILADQTEKENILASEDWHLW